MYNNFLWLTDIQDIIKCNCRQLSVISLFQCNSFRLEEHILWHFLASWYSYTEGAAVSFHLITSFIALCGRRKTLHSTWYTYIWQRRANIWGYKELLETEKVPNILPIGREKGRKELWCTRFCRRVEGTGEEVLAIKCLDFSNGRKRRYKMVTDEKLLRIFIVFPLSKSTSNVFLH